MFVCLNLVRYVHNVIHTTIEFESLMDWYLNAISQYGTNDNNQYKLILMRARFDFCIQMCGLFWIIYRIVS